jgi:hypothetical protein
MLYLARPPTCLDTHADPSSYIVCDGLRILSAYAFAVRSLPGRINNRSVVLLVVIVPQIVPMKYVSTTLGAHKSVGVMSIQLVWQSLTSHFFKLEQTGSVIMQTLAGLALDTEHQRRAGKTAPDAPSRAIQYLLNTFALLNVFHFLALLALSRLDRRRKAAAVLITNTHGSPGGILCAPYHQNQSGPPKSAGYTEDAERAEDTISFTTIGWSRIL